MWRAGLGGGDGQAAQGSPSPSAARDQWEPRLGVRVISEGSQGWSSLYTVGPHQVSESPQFFFL